MFLIYGGPKLIVFQSDGDDYKSQSRYMFMLNGGVVSWKSSKQEMSVDSTMKAEYIVASDEAKKVIWSRKFIIELDVVPSIVDPVLLYYDNNGAIMQAKEPRSHQWSKLVFQKYHVIREIIRRNDEKIE